MIYAKRILASIAFVIGLVVILRGASYIVVPKNNMKEFGMEEVEANGILGEGKNTIDVLVLGDSESYSSISPMQIWKEKGYTSYVCGTSAQQLDYSQRLLHRAFENQSPKIVILETNAIYREVSREKAIVSRLANSFPVFEYHDRWKNLNLNDLKHGTKYTWTDTLKGYKYNRQIVASTKKEHMNPTDKQATIPSRNIQYVKEMAEFCEENGAQFILLSTPSTINWNYERHNGIKNLASELGCEYIDLNLKNDEVQINWDTDTKDKGDHLNHSGATKVTTYLSNFLEQKKILEDHRQKKDFAMWNDSYNKYEMLIQ